MSKQDARVEALPEVTYLGSTGLLDDRRLELILTSEEKGPIMTLHQAARNGDLKSVSGLLADENVVSKVNALDENGMSPLHYAARFNHHHVVRMLVEDGKADPSVKDAEKTTPLHYACRKKLNSQNTSREYINAAVKTINFLLEYCDVNARDMYGSTPLHFAAMRGNHVACRTLLKNNNVLTNAQDNMGCTALHIAATYNRREVAATLIRKGIRILHADNSKCTALHQACIEGSAEVVALLLEKVEPRFKESLVTSEDNEQNQAIHFAIEARSLECVKLLIDNGASVSVRCRLSSTASTPLHLAAMEDSPDIIKLLLEHGASIGAQDLGMATPLHRAVEYRCQQSAAQLLSNVDCPLEVRDDQNYTPLLLACCYSEPEVVRLLLAESVDVTACEDQERSGVFLAANFGQEEVLKVLIDHVSGTEFAVLINQVDHYGNSPLHVAAKTGNLEIVQLLLDNDADMLTKNEDEETPFLVACEHGRAKVIEELLSRDDRCLNDEDELSNSGLHSASREGHFAVVHKLVDAGADKDARNNRLHTPLDLAAMKGHVKIVEFLLDEDVPVNPPDKDKEPPLHLASRNGHAAVVSLLIERGADVARLFQQGVSMEPYNCLDVAINNGNRSVVAAILQSDKWAEALNNETNLHERRITPLRKITRSMPDIVPLALNKMIKTGPEGVTSVNPEYYVEFNFDFLDDTYKKYREKDVHQDDHIYTSCNTPLKHERPYTNNLNWVKQNHPLTRMVEDKQGVLLSHPAVLALIRHKWSTARIFYFLYLIFNALFMSLVTAYMITATSEKFVKLELAEDGINPDSFNCTSDENYQSEFNETAKVFIWIMVIMGAIIEGFQFASMGFLYFDLVNILDWFTYISASLIIIDFRECGIREDWQWELGAFSVLFCWLDFLLFLRRMPGLGLYVVMITEIFWTFARFFAIFFLFIVAFALSNYILLQNKDPFSTPFYAIMKTWVMFLGEFDFGDIFFPEEESEALQYEAASYALFAIFLILMAIIIMNLLVGLAVDDVYALREQAKLVKLHMQIDLALDVEMALPEKWKRGMMCNVRRARILPNEVMGLLTRTYASLQTLIEGPLLSTKAIHHAVNNLDMDDLPDLEHVEERLEQRLQNTKEQLDRLHDRLDTIEALIRGQQQPALQPQ